METHEMKAIWQSIDERLKKQELFRQEQVRDVLRAKTSKSLGVLHRLEVVNTTILLVIFPVVAWAFDLVLKNGMKNFPSIFTFVKVFLISFLILGAIQLLWTLYKIIVLSRIDLAGNIRENTRLIHGYNLMVRRETVVNLILTPFFIGAGVYLFASLHVSFAWWSFQVCAYLFAIVMSFYFWYRIYKPHMAAVQKSLEELKDLDDDDAEE